MHCVSNDTSLDSYILEAKMNMKGGKSTTSVHIKMQIALIDGHGVPGSDTAL